MSRTAALSYGPWIERRPPGPVMAPTYLNAADDFLSTFSISLAKSLGASRRWIRGAATLVFPEKSCVRLVDISGPLQLTLDRSALAPSAPHSSTHEDYDSYIGKVSVRTYLEVRVGCWLGEDAAYRVEVIIRVGRVDVVPMLAIVLSLCLVEVLSRRRTRLGSSGIFSVVDFIPLQMCVDSWRRCCCARENLEDFPSSVPSLVLISFRVILAFAATCILLFLSLYNSLFDTTSPPPPPPPAVSPTRQRVSVMKFPHVLKSKL